MLLYPLGYPSNVRTGYPNAKWCNLFGATGKISTSSQQLGWCRIWVEPLGELLEIWILQLHRTNSFCRQRGILENSLEATSATGYCVWLHGLWKRTSALQYCTLETCGMDEFEVILKQKLQPPGRSPDLRVHENCEATSMNYDQF